MHIGHGYQRLRNFDPERQSSMFSTKSDRDAFLNSLAAGYGDVDVIRLLAKGQIGLRMLQMRRATANADPSKSARSRENLTLLARIQRTNPSLVASLLADPDLGGQRKKGNDCEWIALVAASAAVKAGVQASVSILLDQGGALLPGLGTISLKESESDEVVLCIDPPKVSLVAGDESVELPTDLTRRSDHWRPLRRLMLNGKGIRYVDDGPLRAAFGSVYATNTTKSQLWSAATAHRAVDQLQDWQSSLDGAWELLDSSHPDLAKAVNAGVSAIVPLAQQANDRIFSGTLAGVFGAIAMTLPRRPDIFASQLVHELQHSKLAAALDLLPMYEAHDQSTYYAPWREDPRPLGALLQGVYAFLGQAHCWDLQRKVTGSSDSLLADVEFIRWTTSSRRACEEIQQSPALNEAGKVFVDALMREATRLDRQPVSSEARQTADRFTLDHKISWRLRNLRVDDSIARAVAEEWFGTRKFIDIGSDAVTLSASPRKIIGESARTGISLRLLIDACDDLADFAGSSIGDQLFARGSHHEAAAVYKGRIMEDPNDFDAWGGLAIALSSEEGSASHKFLTDKPEVAASVYQQAARISSEVVHVHALLQWLSDRRAQWA
ncbi:HEXXH motif domain-containing protein [Streptomyces sp. NPDC004237]|uniref:HEXXH motif domain-containing protein n=1 Tax=Streptomyces sp. NPDC004237 TaxID=3154455 RepID=UPI0033B4DAB6